MYIHLFGEYAFQDNKKAYAHLTGVEATLGSRVDLSAIYRNYGPGFESNYTSGFGVTNTTNNEKQVVINQQCNAICEVMNKRYISSRERGCTNRTKHSPSRASGADIRRY